MATWSRNCPMLSCNHRRRTHVSGRSNHPDVFRRSEQYAQSGFKGNTLVIHHLYLLNCIFTIGGQRGSSARTLGNPPSRRYFAQNVDRNAGKYPNLYCFKTVPETRSSKIS